MRLKALIIYIAMQFLCTASLAATVYVSTTGNDDTGTGSSESPYLTIDKGVSEATDGDTLSIGTGTYTLTGDVTINKNLTVVPAGAITIDGNAANSLICSMPSGATSPITIELLGTVTDTITVTNCQSGEGGGFLVKSESNQRLKVSLSFVYLSLSTDSNGMGIAGNPVGNVEVVCNYCKAWDNNNDGFSINVNNNNNKAVTLTLNQCISYSNGSGTAGGAGDGATMHSPGQVLIINGGAFYENEKSGISVIGNSTDGGCVYVYDAYFWGNGTVAHNNGDVYAGGALTSILLENCVFHSYDYTKSTNGQIYVSYVGSTTIRNCTLAAPSNAGSACNIVYFASASAGPVLIENCDFYGFVSGSTAVYSIYALSLANGIVVDKCRFANGRYGIRTPTGAGLYSVKNNLFSGYLTAIWDADSTTKYGSMSNCGYNAFRSVTNNTQSGTSQATDNPYIPLYTKQKGAWW